MYRRRWLVSFVALSLASSMPFSPSDARAGDRDRTPIEAFSQDMLDSVTAPDLSRFSVTDFVVDCDAGEAEMDALLLFGVSTFSPFEDKLVGAKVTLCTGTGPPPDRRVLVSPTWEALKTGDLISGEDFVLAFEYRQLGNISIVAGMTGSGNIVAEGVWNGTDVMWSKAFGTGFDLGDGSTLQTISGLGAIDDGTRNQLAVTYTDSMGRERLGFFEKNPSWLLRGGLMASDFGLAEFSQPRAGLDCPGRTAPGDPGCANPAPVFFSYYGSEMFSGGNTELRHTWLPLGPITTLNSTRTIGVGDVTPLNGETLSQFGLGFSHAAGNQIGGFIGTTSSGASGYFQYTSMSVEVPTLVTGTLLPDTTTTATEFDSPSYDYDRVALLGRGAPNLEGVYLAEVDADEGGTLIAAGYRSRVDPIDGNDTTDIFISPGSVRWGVSTFGVEHDFGATLGVGVMDVESLDFLRGPEGTLFGSNPAGLIRIGSSRDMGFQLLSGPFMSGFEGGTRDMNGDFYFATSLGAVYGFDPEVSAINLAGSTGVSDVTGLGVDDQGDMYLSTANELRRVALPGFTPSLVGSYADLSGPVTNIRGLEWDAVNQFMGAIGADGRYFSVDLGTAFLTHQQSFELLPGATPESVSADFDSRYVSGFSDGRVATYVDPGPQPPSGMGAGPSGGGPLPPLLPVSVLGATGGGSVTSIVVPEPTGHLLPLGALLTLGLYANESRRRDRARRRRRSRRLRD